MPELPEVEITARRLDEALRGAVIESSLAPGINALKTFDPPLHAIDGQAIAGVRRIGKLFVVDVGDELSLLIHLMSAGRLQLYDKRASMKDRTSRLLLRLADVDDELLADPAHSGDRPAVDRVQRRVERLQRVDAGSQRGLDHRPAQRLVEAPGGDLDLRELGHGLRE